MMSSNYLGGTVWPIHDFLMDEKSGDTSQIYEPLIFLFLPQSNATVGFHIECHATTSMVIKASER
jgi:hypothetical protein